MISKGFVPKLSIYANPERTHQMTTTSGPPNGHLLLHGGGAINDGFKTRFKDLAGGPNAKIVYIPTADSDDKISGFKNGTVCSIDVLGLAATILHTRSQREANSEQFVKPLQEASGVFIDGGRQPRLADAYFNTRTHRELQLLLDRGGVIAGTSAGATILGSFLVRGQGYPDYDNRIIIGDHREGFGFIKDTAIDQHIQQFNRESHLAEVLKVYPYLLGIGIDEDTAIHIESNKFTVFGAGSVFVHDGSPPHYLLSRGQEFDLQTRTVL